ncbi:MAG: ABC transporter permease [Candidatus Kapabacteria bacterium]|nr:ABC transporter permease [Candidatus Kapabacteria bacterium]MDW8011967.1 ABC transporter permease [Bacteroidota bacterium]
MVWAEIARGALESLRAYRLRSGLTVLGVALGVFAIMVAGTATDSLEGAISQELLQLGESSFFISRMPPIGVSGREWREYLRRPPITYQQGQEFKRQMALWTPFVCLYAVQPSDEQVQWGNRATDPDVSVMGTDEMAFRLLNVQVAEGRPFAEADVAFMRPLAILGADVARELFGSASPVGQQVRIRGHLFEVIGVARPRGSIFGQSQDNFVFIPVGYFMRFFASEEWGSLTLIVQPRSRREFQATLSEAVGILRRLRGLKPWQPENFEVTTNEGLQAQLSGLTQFVGLFGTGTGVIALVAAGIGIMNIMLVAVRERTREIGIRKAVGARRSWILVQFLTEAVVLSLCGGVVGIVAGIGAGWGISALVGIPPSLPWQWMGLSFFLCVALGLLWGTYPAWKAATLNPVDALRYE